MPDLLLQASFSLNRPDIHAPLIGNRWFIGALFLAHIVFGSFSMGAVLLSPAFEIVGVWRRDPRFERMAHGIAATNLKIFSLGATWASFAVLALAGLYPSLFVSLITIFFWPMLIAFLSWLVTIPLLLVYVFRWRRMEARKGRHIAIGVAGGLSEQLFLVLIVGLSSFMLTPSKSLGLSTFFNASYAPELIHRFIGNLSWAGFFIAAVYAVWAGLSRAVENRLFYQWAARMSLVVGFLTLLLQVPAGFLFAEAVKRGSPGAFTYSLEGQFAWLWIVQGVLLGILVVGSNLYFWQSRPVRSAPGAVITALVVVLMLLEVAPSSLYPRSVFWVRYVFLAAALLLSLTHWLIWRSPREVVTLQVRTAGHTALAVTGVSAMLLFLLMGVIRETARGPYTVYGQLKESDSQGIFQPPSKGFYP